MKRTYVVNFNNYPNIKRWGFNCMSRPSYRIGIEELNPWQAPMMCQVLRMKGIVLRKGFAPNKARR
jgi:hypothetical protein